jgi:outer membrane protein OmpA-like peptidoglycan-associated protein
MTGRVIAILLSPTLFVLLAFSQQASPNPPAQAPVQNIGSTCKEPLTPSTTGDFWNGNEPNVANLFGHYINSKKDVREDIKPIQNCLDDLDAAATEHTRLIKEMDSRNQQGVQLASSKTSEADSHATDATNRANAALQAANQSTTHVSNVEYMATSVGQYKGAGTETEIRFRSGQTALSKTAKDALDQLGSTVKDQQNYVLEVRGYSPGSGQAAIANSLDMADSVARYLVLNCHVPVRRIFVLGMGNAEATNKDNGGTKRNNARRVEVSLLKNDVQAAEQH